MMASSSDNSDSSSEDSVSNESMADIIARAQAEKVKWVSDSRRYVKLHSEGQKLKKKGVRSILDGFALKKKGVKLLKKASNTLEAVKLARASYRRNTLRAHAAKALQLERSLRSRAKALEQKAAHQRLIANQLNHRVVSLSRGSHTALSSNNEK